MGEIKPTGRLILQLMRRNGADVQRMAGRRTFGLHKPGRDFIAAFQARSIDNLAEHGLIALVDAAEDLPRYRLTDAGVAAVDGALQRGAS